MELDFDLENPLLLSSDESIPSLFHTEADHMPSPDYPQSLTHLPLSRRRRQILSFILRFSTDLDRFSLYLAINYMDRFLSVHPLVGDEKPWISKLVAVSCFSLALKMRQIDFSVSDLQDDAAGMVVDSVTVERMEKLILGALKWRMRSINPFSFISFFLSFFDLKDQKSLDELKEMATRIIFKAQYDVKLLGFKPSIVAASALLHAAHQLLRLPFTHSRDIISKCEYINMENLFKCYNMMQHLSSIDGCNSFMQTSLSLCTPPNLLDVEYSSSSTLGNKRMHETSMCRDGEIKVPKRLKFDDLAMNK